MFQKLSLRTFTGFLAAFLIACAALSFCGCESGGSDVQPSDGEPVFDGKMSSLSSDELSAFTIIRPEDGGDMSVAAAVELRKVIEEFASIKLSTDYVNLRSGETVPEDNPEILVGATNRADSARLTEGLRYNDFVIARSGSHIVIAGGGDSSTADAVAFFIENFISDGVVSFPDKDFVYHCDYPIDSLTLNGKDISEYSILIGYGLSETRSVRFPERVAEAVCSLTGYLPKVNAVGSATADESVPLIRLETADIGADICEVAFDGKDIILRGADADTVICAAKLFFSEVLGAGSGKISKKTDITISEDEPVSLDCGKIASMEPVVTTITPDDIGDIQNLINEAGTDSLLSLAPRVVEFAAGEYRLTETILIGASISGTKYAPFTLRAAKGADVRFTGGEKVDLSRLKKVTDEKILSRLADKSAAERLYVLDASGYFLESPYYNGSTFSNRPARVFVNGEALTRSRYPNASTAGAYLRAGSKIYYDDYKSGNISFKFKDADGHIKNNWTDETVKDLYIFGFLAYDWTNDQIKVDSLDFESGTVVTKSGTSYEPNPETRFYFYNILEEIDVPGESYFDAENELLYFYPYEDVTEMWISSLEKPFIDLTGAKSVVIEGISFLYSREKAFTGSGLSDVTIRNCAVAHNSSNAMSLNGTRITIDGCEIYDTWIGGVNLNGGDRLRLISGESVIKNCAIHDVNRSEETYRPGVYAGSVGLKILNNRFWGNTHEMIAVNTNDVVIQYNEIFSCVTEAADMGAIYFGRNPTLLGIDIGFNYFHDLGNSYGGSKYGGSGQQAVFCDDGSLGAYVHDNIFYKASQDPAPIKAHGGQYYLIENNIFLDMPAAFMNQSWQDKEATTSTRWCRYMYENNWARMDESGFESEIWHKRYDGTIWGNIYKHLSTETENKIVSGKLTDEEKAAIYKELAPDTTNVLRGNVYMDIKEAETSGSIHKGGAIVEENNVELEKSDFVDYDGGNFTLSESGLKKVRETIPDFRNIDMTKIGPGGND